MRTTIHIDDRAYSREVLTIDLEVLHYLQRESIKSGTTPSQIINQLVLQAKEESELCP